MSPTVRRRDQRLQTLAHSYTIALLIAAVLAPSALGWYLYQGHGNSEFFRAPVFHEIVIAIAIGFSALVSYFTFRCYQQTGKGFLLWLLYGFVAFTIIYAPHGFLTRAAEDNIWLFILYGPASRLVMTACFLVAILQFGKESHPDTERGPLRLLSFALICALICLLVAWLATSPVAGERALRWSMELLAIAFCLSAVAILWYRRIDYYLMLIYGAALMLFAQSSLTFMFTPAWSHLWWYAHLIFAAGFALISYGVAKAFRHTGSFEDVYSQEDLMTQLREAVANYQRSNEELSHFAHLVSHDLKAPMRQLSTYVDFIQEDLSPEPDSEISCHLRQIDKSATRMRQLIDGLLALSSAERSPINLQTVDMNELMTEARDMFSTPLAECGGTLHWENLPSIEADHHLLFEVFQNLIQNAIKYRSPERPLHIDISCRQQGDAWRFDIADNGSGFDSSHKDTVFQLFGRLHSEDISGSGAGLAICSKILQRHGGSMDVDAEVGRGSTFSVFLPRKLPG